MPKHKRNKKNDEATKNPTSMVDMNATIKQLQSQLVDPNVYQWLVSGSRGVRQRLLSINFDVLRRTADKLPLINAIINARADQILPFCHYAREEGEKGFRIILNDRFDTKKKEDERQIMQLAEFFEQTGFNYDPEREDDFSDYVQMVVREIYTIDQIATEVQYNRKGDAIAFWLLDGATVKRVSDEGDWARGVRFVQEIESKIYNEYTENELLFDYKNKRADIRFRGYGYSYTEMAIDIITTLLFGYNYVRDQLVRDKVPKGFISVMGDIGKPQIDSLRSYWYAAMSGAGGQWNIPILPSGKDGVGVDFKSLGQSNRDMEYHKLMLFTSSILGAVFGMDLAELGLKSDDSTSIINNESAEPRLKQSRNRGLASMLSFIEQHVNKILRKVTTDYIFKFEGVEVEDEQRREDIRGKQLSTYRTINEIREEAGEELIEADYANIPLHPQAVQIYLQSKQAEQAEQMQQQQDFGGEDYTGMEPPDLSDMFDDDEPETDDEPEDDDSEMEDEVPEDEEKKGGGLKKSERVIRYIIE